MMDIAKSMKDMDSATARNAAVIELQERIFTAHATQTALLERVDDLEKKVAKFEKWESEKERYELKQLGAAFVAYVLKKPERHMATAHAICTNCYERGFKSILQSNGETNVYLHKFVCPSCKATFASQSRKWESIFETLKQQDGV